MRAIVLTHGHNDHINAAVPLRDAVDAPILLHDDDRMLWDVVWPGRCTATERSSRARRCSAGGTELARAAHAGALPRAAAASTTPTSGARVQRRHAVLRRARRHRPELLTTSRRSSARSATCCSRCPTRRSCTPATASRRRSAPSAPACWPAPPNWESEEAWPTLPSRSPAWSSTTRGATARSSPSCCTPPPTAEPWAELWLGTHPNGPGDRSRDTTARRSSPASCRICSRCWRQRNRCRSRCIRHVSRRTTGIARGVYPDDRAKPELLCALTRFDALCGIRPVAATTHTARSARRRAARCGDPQRRDRRRDRGAVSRADRSSPHRGRVRSKPTSRSRTASPVSPRSIPTIRAW